MPFHAATHWMRSHKVSLSVGAGMVALHGGAYAFFAGRNPYSTTIFPPCPFLHITGWQCPGCGGTRSMFSLLNGDIITSLQMNPIVVAGYLSVILALVGVVVGRRGSERAANLLYWAAAAIAIGATVWSMLIRNLIQ